MVDQIYHRQQERNWFQKLVGVYPSKAPVNSLDRMALELALEQEWALRSQITLLERMLDDERQKLYEYEHPGKRADNSSEGGVWNGLINKVATTGVAPLA